MSYARYALYYVPPDGPLADFGAAWLGWDLPRAREAPQPDLPGVQEVTKAPRKYGFHATLKPPFRLAEGCSGADLDAAASMLAAGLAPARCEGLEMRVMGRFLTLIPRGDPSDLGRVAAAAVRALDRFRAQASVAELARRRGSGLTARQDALLIAWGYPYVMEEFRFHLTLTGRLPQGGIEQWCEVVQRHLPELPQPFELDQIALCGERADGRFELIRRYPLTG